MIAVTVTDYVLKSAIVEQHVKTRFGLLTVCNETAGVHSVILMFYQYSKRQSLQPPPPLSFSFLTSPSPAPSTPTFPLPLQSRPRLDRIIKVWKSGHGVIPLQFFHGITDDEGFCREELMITTIGKSFSSLHTHLRVILAMHTFDPCSTLPLSSHILSQFHAAPFILPHPR